MSREIDWKVHELTGNDLTGWEWASDKKDIARNCDPSIYDFEYIPHYSTTWEGAGLVMEWMKRRDFDITIELLGDKASVQIGSRRPILGTTLPQALCKAYISAMEERDGG